MDHSPSVAPWDSQPLPLQHLNLVILDTVWPINSCKLHDYIARRHSQLCALIRAACIYAPLHLPHARALQLHRRAVLTDPSGRGIVFR